MATDWGWKAVVSSLVPAANQRDLVNAVAASGIGGSLAWAARFVLAAFSAPPCWAARIFVALYHVTQGGGDDGWTPLVRLTCLKGCLQLWVASRTDFQVPEHCDRGITAEMLHPHRILVLKFLYYIQGFLYISTLIAILRLSSFSNA